MLLLLTFFWPTLVTCLWRGLRKYVGSLGRHVSASTLQHGTGSTKYSAKSYFCPDLNDHKFLLSHRFSGYMMLFVWNTWEFDEGKGPFNRAVFMWEMAETENVYSKCSLWPEVFSIWKMSVWIFYMWSIVGFRCQHGLQRQQPHLGSMTHCRERYPEMWF